MQLVKHQFIVENNNIEEISDLMFTLGVLSIELSDQNDNPIFSTNEEPDPLWPQIKMNATCNPNVCDAKLIINEVQHAFNITLNYTTTSQVKEQDWQQQWQEQTKPIVINDHLVIVPDHIKTPQPQTMSILLEPGLAFGSGSHPTTAMCLDWLSTQSLTNKNILDLGCGSGILGITAMKLGAKKLIAVDNDPQALQATQDNCYKNNLDLNNITITLPNNNLDFIADIILANIYLNVLIDLKPIIQNTLAKHGTALLTGILTEQINTLSYYYQDMQIVQIINTDGWATLIVKP